MSEFAGTREWCGKAFSEQTKKAMAETNKPQKKSIPFFEILKEAGQIVWQNRFLLWFGFLMALGSPGSFNIGGDEQKLGNQSDKIGKFFEAHWQIVVILAIVLFAVGIILLLVSLVAKAGLVKSVNLLSQGKTTNFKEGWRTGKKYLGKLFWLAILFFFVILVLTIVLAIPVVYLIATKSWIAAVLVGVLAVAIFIPLIFIFSLTKAYAEFYVILSGLRVRSAIETGYDLLLKNIGNSIVFALLLLAVSFAAGIILLPVAGLALLILVPSGIAFFYLNKIAFGIFLFFAILIFLAAILFVSSIFRAYTMTAWTLFFRALAKVEKPETAGVVEEALEKPVAATPVPPTTQKSQ